MKKLIVLAALLFSSPAFAQEAQTHRPFRYETPCGIETKDDFFEDTCIVIETRESNGALRTRNIFSNKFALTIKSRFDKEKGFVQTDSHNKFEYQWQYKLGGTGWTIVMPGVLLENVSWD